MMALNHKYWSYYFRKLFIPHLELLLDVLEMRIMPAFDNIDAEAEKKSDEAWERWLHSTGDPDADPADAADRAFEIGL